MASLGTLKKIRNTFAALAACVPLVVTTVQAQEIASTIIRPGEDKLEIVRLPTPGGEVILPTAKDRLQNHDQYLFAAARRAGDFVYLSGVIVGRLPGEANDLPAFKAQLRRAFTNIDRNLKAAGASFPEVVDMQTLAIFGGPDFTGDMNAELFAYAEVKAEFMKPPYPTETLVGVSRLVEPGGLMEIRLVAFAPRPGAKH